MFQKSILFPIFRIKQPQQIQTWIHQKHSFLSPSCFHHFYMNILICWPKHLHHKWKWKTKNETLIQIHLKCEKHTKKLTKNQFKKHEKIWNLCIKTRDIAENAFKLINENAVINQFNEMINKFNQIINSIFIEIDMIKSNIMINLEKKIDNIIKMRINLINFLNQCALNKIKITTFTISNAFIVHNVKTAKINVNTNAKNANTNTKTTNNVKKLCFFINKHCWKQCTHENANKKWKIINHVKIIKSKLNNKFNQLIIILHEFIENFNSYEIQNKINFTLKMLKSMCKSLLLSNSY